MKKEEPERLYGILAQLKKSTRQQGAGKVWLQEAVSALNNLPTVVESENGKE
ncbi:TPA: hypothetical protein ACIPVM_004302 [Salmonella enterica subsp. diarizonae serovar 50:k:z35]